MIEKVIPHPPGRFSVCRCGHEPRLILTLGRTLRETGTDVPTTRYALECRCSASARWACPRPWRCSPPGRARARRCGVGDIHELRRALCGIRVVAEKDGHALIRRNSMLNIVDQRVTGWQADSARMDWLERNPRLAEIVVDGHSTDCYVYAVSGAPGMKLREIIDAAMHAPADKETSHD